MFWGISPSLDLLQEYKSSRSNAPSAPSTLNILILGGQDARHVLKTLAKRYRHEKTVLKFYIVEASVETIARQLLLLNIALQEDIIMGLIPKVRLFMELYGNTLVRPSVAKFLNATATELLKMVTDFEYFEKKMRNFKLELKYKERDYLENLLKFWCGKQQFDVCESWDRRLRKSLGVRYDAKVGVFDWDLHMRMHSVGANQICTQEYRSFRQNGVSFTWLETEMSLPNRSLVCVIAPNGESFLHFGYLGDMQTGPFIAYGLDCDDKAYLKSTHGKNSYRATDVTERNLCQLIHELHHSEKYAHEGVSDLKLGAVTLKEPEKRVVDVNAPALDPKTIRNRCVALDDVEIRFVSVSQLELMKFRDEYKGLFGVMYFGHCYVRYLSGELVGNAAEEGALLLVENCRFVPSYRDKELRKFGEEITQAMDGIRVKKCEFDVCKDDFAKFVKA